MYIFPIELSIFCLETESRNFSGTTIPSVFSDGKGFNSLFYTVIFLLLYILNAYLKISFAKKKDCSFSGPKSYLGFRETEETGFQGDTRDENSAFLFADIIINEWTWTVVGDLKIQKCDYTVSVKTDWSLRDNGGRVRGHTNSDDGECTKLN